MGIRIIRATNRWYIYIADIVDVIKEAIPNTYLVKKIIRTTTISTCKDNIK